MICIACQQPFPATNPKRKYCSRKCFKRAFRQRQYAKQTPLICVFCSKDFRSHTDKPQSFCSKRCGLLHRFNSPEYIASIPDRFWSHVQKSDGCWEWQSYRRRGGYGEFSISSNHVLVHRYSWELHNGPIPENAVVCHACDNPSCVRPDHLFIGTPQDNVDDMVDKGRQAKGVKSAGSKLTPDDIRAIRLSPLKSRALGQLYGVSHSAIGAILRRETWKHVD